MGWGYDLMMRALIPWVKRKIRRRAQIEPLYGVRVGERWGRYEQPAARVDVWLHAVSLGEARAARVLVDRLRALKPQWRWVFTQGTATGHQELESCVLEQDQQVWQPWDDPDSVRSFLDHFRPRMALIMETEVWPNWVRACARRGIPMVLVNARLSEQSLAKAQRLWFWSRPAYGQLSLALAQTQGDADRLTRAGVRKVKVKGNLKFDARIHHALWQAGRALRNRTTTPVLMLASSREGEEALWAAIWQRVRHAWPMVTWLIVPRHPQRFDEVAEALSSAGLSVVRRSSWPTDASDWPPFTPGCVMLGDSLGEMALYYGLSDLALMGGSFAPLGGQNLIESCACECPVLVGPHTFNFLQATELAIGAGAAHRVADLDQAVSVAREWLDRPQALIDRRRAALSFTQAHQGAAEAMAQEILKLAEALE